MKTKTFDNFWHAREERYALYLKEAAMRKNKEVHGIVSSNREEIEKNLKLVTVRMADRLPKE
jgi:hypothetical protein